MMNMEGFTEYGLLVDAIGEKSAAKVCRIFGGRSVYFPRRFEILEKHQRLLADFHQSNLSYRALAEKYGYTENHIRYIINNDRTRRLKKKNAQSDQPLLFSELS